MHAVAIDSPFGFQGRGRTRRNPLLYWLALAMLGLIAFLYASPTIQALRMPGTPGAAIALKLPALGFASFAVPKLQAAPKAAVIPPPAAPRRVLRKAAVRPAVRHVPIVTDTHTNVAIPPTATKSKPDPFANGAGCRRRGRRGTDPRCGRDTDTDGCAAPATPPPAASSSVTYTFFSMSDDTQPSDTVTSDDQTGVSSTTAVHELIERRADFEHRHDDAGDTADDADHAGASERGLGAGSIRSARAGGVDHAAAAVDAADERAGGRRVVDLVDDAHRPHGDEWRPELGDDELERPERRRDRDDLVVGHGRLGAGRDHRFDDDLDA